MIERYTVWRVKEDATRPVAVQCEEPGYPNKDENGQTMHDNDTFLRESDAWAALLRERLAHHHLAASDYEQAATVCDRASVKLTVAAALRARAEKAFADWKDGKEGERA